MKDDIKLPPLHYDELPENDDAIPAMHNYARKAIKADRQQRGEHESNLLTKFFAALDQATALDSKQSQWSNKTVGSHHERIIAWAEVHRLRGLLAPQNAASVVPDDPPGDNFGSAEHWKEKAQCWADEVHNLRQQALRGEPVDGIIQPATPKFGEEQ